MIWNFIWKKVQYSGGTEVPDDYLPRIWSRFEGREMETLSGLLNLGELDHKAGATSENVVIRGKGTIEGSGRVTDGTCHRGEEFG